MDTGLKAKYSFRGWPKADYLEFFISLGTVFLAFILALGFTIALQTKHIHIPPELYSIPIGFGLFFVAYVWDSLAHRSLYKGKIERTELMIHNFMVSSGGFVVLSFILAYWMPGFMLPFIVSFLFLKTMYSIIDEAAMHWPRFKEGRSDAIEMAAHAFQFFGNIMYDIGWLYLIYWNKYEVIHKLFN